MFRLVYKFIGNFFWKLFGGVAYSLIWFALSIILTLSIAGFPLAVKCFRIGYLVWKPFGKSVAVMFTEFPLSNVLWGGSIGLILSISALVSAFISAVSIIGLPLAKQWLKVSKLSLFPFGAFIK